MGKEFYDLRKTQSAQAAETPHHHIEPAMVLSLVACMATSLPSACSDKLASKKRQVMEEPMFPTPHWYDTEGPIYQSWRALRPGWLYHPGPTGASTSRRSLG
eukprot:10573208-Heterocapsa_arctica.AAC.1